MQEFQKTLKLDIERWKNDASMLEGAGFHSDAEIVRGFIREATTLLDSHKKKNA
jgi:hypothetical protein